MLAHLHEVALGGRERVLQDAENRVRTGPTGPRLGRATAEVVLVETNHLIRDLSEDGAAASPVRRLLPSADQKGTGPQAGLSAVEVRPRPRAYPENRRASARAT